MDAKNFDKLDRIFEMQAVLDGYIREKRQLDFRTDEWIQKRSLAMLSEISELLAEVNFKWWKNPKDIDVPAVKEELVDILHFLVGMCLDVGMTAEEMFSIYYDKNKENFDRQDGKSLKKGYELKPQ
ncbi:MAG: dUTPase [Clostridiales bacterium]|nr:dUTPase [Clostridiales bacterium]